jgi:anthranilate 1,2-dioxygenase small subunit
MTYSEKHHRQCEQLIFSWARAIDEDRVEAIAELIEPQGRYTVKSRFNHDRNLPLAVIDAHSAAQLRDRILSMRKANVYQPQLYRHILSGIEILDQDADGCLNVRHNFLIIRTMELSGDMKVFASGQTQDKIAIHPDGARFKERLFLFDSRVVETLMVIPL